MVITMQVNDEEFQLRFGIIHSLKTITVQRPTSVIFLAFMLAAIKLRI